MTSLLQTVATQKREIEHLTRVETTRIRPYGNVTLYVRSDGADGNTGLSNDAAGAFLTIQRAIDVACHTYDGGGHSCIIQVQDGTWALTSTLILHAHRWGAGLVLQGNVTTPANCVLQGNTDGMWIIVSQFASNYLTTIKGFKIQRGGAATNIQGVVCRLSSKLFLESMDFGNVGSGAHMLTSEWAELAIQGAYTVSGGAAYHVSSDINSWVVVGGSTITFTGTPTIGRWCVAQRNSGVLHRSGGSLSGAVTISTERYLCQITSFVEGIANMPGAGGTVAWGGVAL